MTREQPSGFDVYVWLEDAPWYDQRHPALVIEAPKDWWEEDVDAVTRLTANRWRAGVISRLALQLLVEMKEAEVAGQHGCAGRYGHERELADPCGSCMAYDVIDQIGPLASGDSAYVSFIVPDTEGPRWLERARELLRQILVNDATPAPVDSGHGSVVLREGQRPALARGAQS